MSRVYLVRHGQAGTRHAYDALSETGRRQARRLGEHLAANGVIFRAAYTGTLARQRETAAEVAAAYAAAGAPFPEIRSDPGWNEFDLDAVYREVAPALAADDAAFAREYAELLRLAADDGHAVHRTWSPCDAEIVRAWIDGRYRAGKESWEEFVARVEGRFRALLLPAGGEAVAVFTSAVPVAIGVALSLGVANGSIMRIAAVIHNSAYTVLRASAGELALFGFNAVPHLAGEPALHTFR